LQVKVIIMDRLVEHIERLLLLHDCVIIPDFGGFVLQKIPVVYTGDEHSFTPARNEIVFNPTLVHNDGLLVEAYMKSLGVDFDRAGLLVRLDIASMKEQLKNDEEFQLGSLGLFMKEEDRIIYVPGKDSDATFSASSYGLPIFHFLPLTARKVVTNNAVVTEEPVSKPPVRNKNVVYNIPITRTFLRIAALAAAAVVLFLLISSPVKDVNNSSYPASFIPSELMPKITTEVSSETPSDEQATEEAPTKAAVRTPANVDWPMDTKKAKPETSKTTVKPDPTPSTTTKPETSATTTAATAVSKPYYVIIGSFANRTQANSYIKRLKGNEASTAKLLIKDGRVRVYTQQFPSEEAAQTYVTQLRKNPKHAQAWIYKSK